VVGRLAQRYGVRVQLRHSWYGGVTALVLLPPSITIRSPQVSDTPPPNEGRPEGRLPELAPPPSRGPAPSPDHLPIFEQARSDWFESPVGTPGSSLRRQGQPAGAQQSSGNGTAHGPEDASAAMEAAQALSEEGSIDADPLTVEERSREAVGYTTEERFTAEPLGPAEPLTAEPVGPDQFAADPALTAEPLDLEPDAAETEIPEPLRAEAETTLEFEPPLMPRPSESRRPERLDRTDQPEWPEPEPPPRLPRREPRERADLEPDRPAAARPAERPVGRSRPLSDPLGSQYPFGSVQPPFPRLPEQRPPRFGPVQPDSPGSSPLPQRQRPVQPPAREHEQAPQPVEQTSRPGVPADVATPLPPTLQPASVQTTKAGLPRRVPRANLAPGMVAQAERSGDRAAPPPSGFSRSPEEVRSMLSSYRTGLERGRRMAAGDDLDDRSEGARSGFGGTAPMAPRSDDDATQ
jgi:hypothetical protein